MSIARTTIDKQNGGATRFTSPRDFQRHHLKARFIVNGSGRSMTSPERARRDAERLREAELDAWHHSGATAFISTTRGLRHRALPPTFSPARAIACRFFGDCCSNCRLRINLPHSLFPRNADFLRAGLASLPAPDFHGFSLRWVICGLILASNSVSSAGAAFPKNGTPV